MLTKNYLKSFLLLLCMIVGAGNAWAEEVTYTISSKNTLTPSGTAPSGSSATIAETYSTTKQMTSGNSQTLTLTGYAGYKITGIVLSMKSNKSAGAGKLSYSTDGGTSFSYIIGSSDSGEAFSSEKWYGSYSTSYVDVTKSNLDISCGSSNVIIKIEATVNSLYCQSYKISYESQAPASPLSSIALSGTYPTNFYVGDAFSHEGMTVTATYEDKSNKDVTEKADFSDYDMSNAGSQTVTVSYTENDITKTAKYGITVSERPKFTVTFSDGGSVMEESAGAGVTLPSRAAIGDYTFAGWSETNVAVETTVAPTIIPAGSYNPTANITLYPVYTRTEGGGESEDKSVSVTISEYASAHNWSSGNQYTTIIMDENITVTGDDTGNNSKFYNSSNPHNWRFYATNNGKFTVSTTVGELKNVSVTYTGNTLTYNGNNVTSNTSVAVSGTSATFSVSGSSSNSQVSKIDVDYTIAGTGVIYYFSAPVAAAVERPVITFAENPFLFSTKATITCTTDGAKIYYSYDKETWNEYTAALNITETTTIHAKATKGNDESNIATATVTKNLAEPTVTISGDLTLDLNGETSVEAGTLTAAVTYNEAPVGGATVTWSGNNDAVATINATTGAVTILARGEVTFTATYAGNSDYAEATATKTITVIDSKAPGTEGRPYTVAQAIDAIDNDGDVNGVYVKGVISQIDSYNSNYKSITYWISEDGTTENQFEVYSGKGLNGADFSSKEDLQLGDVVVVYGNITYYSNNNVYEFSAGSQLVSLERKGDAGLSYETTAYYVTVGGTFNAPALTNPHDLTVTYSSSDTEVATVNAETGVVTLGSKVGTTTITASFAGNGEYNAASASYTLTVEYPATTTTLNKTEVELDLADDVPTATLVATVKKGEEVIENATITWTSDNEEVATVDNNGVVTAVAKGTATITATFSADGYKTSTATCEVTVINSASGVIDLAKTGTISFNDFSNAGSYNKTEEEIFVVDGYDFAKFYCMKNSNELQMHAGDGYVILPTIKSTKGYSITVNYYNTGGEAPTLLVGDVTKATGSDGTIEYNSESISETVKILAGSKATYVTSITITPIKDNRTLAFSEPTTEILVNGTATNTATATPAGTITYTSSDEEVATVDAEGKVTGVKIGTATITATVAEDADYNEATASYEVTVNGIPAATDIVLTATDANDAPVVLSEMKVGTIGTFVATYTKAAANVTVTYTSDATDVLTIEDNLFEAAKGGTANVTVTITPDDADHYVAVSKEFEVTVLNAQKGTTVLTLYDGLEETAAGSTLYGTNISLTAELAKQYDGEVTASLKNDAIANVAIEGENITITPKAVGTTTITFTAPETANFEGEVTKNYVLTVTAPEGRTACEVTPAEVVLNETFDGCNGTGGNDGLYNGSVAGKAIVYDGNSWTVENTSGADRCIKVGTSSGGYATTPTLNLEADKTYTISFRVAGWINDGTTLTLSATKGTFSQTNIEMTSGEWTEHTVTLTGANGETTIKFQPTKRCFLDDVKIEIPEVAPAIPDVTIAESGYASFCCEYPLDFSEANENYKAWYVSEVSGTTVTFKQIKGKIAGGVPFFLYGEPGTYHLQVAAEGTETLSGNMLVGTLAPTYVESVVGDYTNFGLSAGSFKKMNNGVVKANKAYLPVLTEGISAGARLNIIFDEEDTPTGISSVNNENFNQRKDVYNLNGQRVENMKKGGLYIVNGKKVFMKGQR